ncbi:bifunctional protein HldE [Zafaria cholistanensis]|uniref:Bifunctional protein HldE n=1 Tax=Zafaria cholistanensis TaxID=1682741 RepID=A0A5A7NRD3_9MICC|nr:PfkB family carbohydrate kinase [Zafaria cholistanensis]GER23116.1 bifunctional protein HldE [Zafaria cholistanensis]
MRIAVVGDVLLDRDLEGISTRLSPDAPVPVVDVESSRLRAGGAGLVAAMLAADGHRTVLVTVLSPDVGGGLLRGQLAGVDVVAGPSLAPTPVKTRVRASGQPLLRFDEGCAPPPVPAVDDRMLAALDEADAIVAADYGRGLLRNPRLRTALERAARRVPVVWDPHPRGPAPVPGVAAATPNLAEAIAAVGSHRNRAGKSDPSRVAAALREQWRPAAVVVTLGAEGAWVDDGGIARPVPAPAITCSDPCGAGDRFAAALAVELATRPPGRASAGRLDAAVRSAVQAAAAYLSDGGVRSLPSAASGTARPATAVSPAATDSPLKAPAPLEAGSPAAAGAAEVARRVRAAGGTLVATGGCFDLLHAGHVRTLRAAREQGDALVVCLNSDASVRRLKGPGRPIMGQEDRVEMLLALECVDAVVVFDEDTPAEALTALRPEVWVKGGDYSIEQLPEAALLAAWGGRCVIVPHLRGRSTTALAAALASG